MGELIAGGLKFVTGKGGVYLVVLLVGAMLGWMGAGLWAKFGLADSYKALAEKAVKAEQETAKSLDVHGHALVSLVQNGGRREMQYAWRMEAERGMFSASLEAFRNWDKLSTTARAAALKDGAQLEASVASWRSEYEALKASLEKADANTLAMLKADLPASIKCVRYADPGCKADGFAAAGYPAPPDRTPALAQPPK